MCDNKYVLLIMLILKIIILIILPIFIIVFHNNRRLKRITNLTFFFEIVILIIFIVMSFFKNDCFITSFEVNKTVDFTGKKFLKEDINSNSLESYNTSKIYKTNKNTNVYYYSINDLPLSDKEIGCSKKAYLKHYGDNITAMSILFSSSVDKNIDPITILNIATKNEMFDCEKGVDNEELLNIISKEYNVQYRHLDIDSVIGFLQEGYVIMANIKNVYGKSNLSCGNSYIILYKVDKDDFISILDPNNKDFDYICPDNTEGYGSIIEKNNNSKVISYNQLKDLANKFYLVHKEGVGIE